MAPIKIQRLRFSLLLLGIYAAAWFIQARLFLNWDVSYLLHAAKLMWAGGSYTRDFFTPNPPLIFYLYLPPLLLSQDWGLNLVVSVRGYLFVLATGSLGLCGYLTTFIFAGQDFFQRAVFILSLAAVFLILPFYDFGQREHLLLILTFPYVLLSVLRLAGAQIKTRWALMAGLMAGLGFALKPQFYFLPLLVESYLLYRRKDFFTVLRCEMLCILGVLTAYASLLFLFYPDYIQTVVPYLLRNFYGSIGEPWTQLLLNQVALFCGLPLILHVLFYRKNPFRELSQMLSLALLGFFGSYLAQQTTFYYHLLPAFALAIILQVLLFSLFISQARLSRADYASAVFIGLLALALGFYQAKWIWLMPIFATTAFFCYCGLLFAFMFFAASEVRSPLGKLVSVLFILTVGFLCFYLAQRTSWSSWEVLLTILVLVALFGLLAPRERCGVGANLVLVSAALVIFAHPVFFSYSLYWKGQEYKEKVLKQLLHFVRQNRPYKSIYVFSVKGSYGSPLVDYAGASLAARFDCLWPVVGFLRRPTAEASQSEDKNRFINMVAEDLATHRPEFVFVDKQDSKLKVWDPHFNYLTFFSQNEHFRKEWQTYHYLTTLKEDRLYELAVYRRSS